MISKAIQFATVAHQNQYRKVTDDTKEPKKAYILHPLEVGIIVSQILYDEEIICAAILHDTVEDAKVSFESIGKIFSPRVLKFVESQSEDKYRTWQERKDHTVAFLKQNTTEREIKIITLADKLSNIRAIKRDLDNPDIGIGVWDRFNEKNSKLQGNYYMGIVEGLSDLCDIPEYKEFAKIVLEVFGN